MKYIFTALKNWHKTFSVRETIRRNDRLWRWLVVIAVILLILAICSNTLTPSYSPITYAVGEISPVAIKAPFNFVPCPGLYLAIKVRID